MFLKNPQTDRRELSIPQRTQKQTSGISDPSIFGNGKRGLLVEQAGKPKTGERVDATLFGAFYLPFSMCEDTRGTASPQSKTLDPLSRLEERGPYSTSVLNVSMVRFGCYQN